MQHSALETAIRRICSNKIRQMCLIIFLMLACAGALVYFTGADLGNVFLKPIGLKGYATLEADYAAGRIFVDQPDAEVMQTWYYQTEDGKKRDSYFAVALGESEEAISNLVLYRQRGEFGEEDWLTLRVTGQLKELEKLDREVRDEFINDLVASRPDMSRSDCEALVSGAFVIRHNNQRVTIWVLTGAGLLAILWMLLTIGKNLRWRGDYAEHKQCRKLTEYMQTTTDELEAEIDGDEAIRAALADKKPSLVTSDKFFLQTTAHTLALRRTPELMWAHPVTTKHYTNGIPTGKTYSIKLHFCHDAKDVVTVACRNKRDMETRMEALSQRFGDTAFCGYAKEMETLHAKNFEDFVAQWKAYAARRAQEKGGAQPIAE